MENERAEYSKEEHDQVKIHLKFLSERRKRFDEADTHLWLQRNQNENDLIYLSDALIEFKGQLKPESKNHKKFEDMLISVLRINAYCTTIESTCKSAVAEYITERNIVNGYKSQLRTKDIEIMKLQAEPKKLQAEIDKLKKQLEFGS